MWSCDKRFFWRGTRGLAPPRQDCCESAQLWGGMQWQVQAWTSALSREESTAHTDRCDSHSTQWSDCMWQRITLKGWSWWSGTSDRGPKHLKRWVTCLLCWTFSNKPLRFSICSNSRRRVLGFSLCVYWVKLLLPTQSHKILVCFPTGWVQCQLSDCCTTASVVLL